MRPQMRRTACVPLGLLALLATVAGCPSPAERPTFVPMDEAIRRVNANNSRFAPDGMGLKGSPVEATGRFRRSAEGGQTSFMLTGLFRFSRPRHFLLNLRSGGELVMQAGTNDEEYWLQVKPEVDTLWWGRHENVPRHSLARTGSVEQMPFRPDQLIEVLGLSELPSDTTGLHGPVYRPEDDRNVLIFLECDERGQLFIQKEYRLERVAPYLVREMVYRQADGQVEMHATLSDYRPLDGTGPLAARHVRVEWPLVESWLELRIRKLTEDVGLRATNPREYGGFGREICVDDWLTPIAPREGSETQAATSAPASAPATRPEDAP